MVEVLIKKAINNARTKADNAASALGLKVIGVKSLDLSELEGPSPRPLLAGQQQPTAETASATTATPIIPGQEQVKCKDN